MNAIATTLLILAYVAVGLFTARRVYSAMRAKEIESQSNYTEIKFDAEDAVMLGFFGFCAGALWPGAIIIGAITYKPHKTPGELKDELAARDRRIQELERELGIR